MKNQIKNGIITTLAWLAAVVPLQCMAESTLGEQKIEAVDRYVHDYLTDHLEAQHVPGAVFVLADRNGELVKKGYGEHRWKDGEPIDPDRHLFRIASITKNFTAVAIMQLVEQGLIDLEADVNQYLKSIQLEDRFDNPVTVRGLLQHTAGIEEQFTGISLYSAEDRIPMAEYFQQNPPVRSYPPGEFSRYTNRAYMLLGHIVEQVSGEEYEDYMRRHITEPLGMHDTVFDPVPEQQQRLTAGTYYVNEQYIESETQTTMTRPSGDFISSAHDMGRYISMFLNGGAFDGQRILQPQTVQQMMVDCFRHHEDIPGSCLGFAEFVTPNGIRVRRHGGYYGGWNADFVLFPDLGVGYFAATNGDPRFQVDMRAQIIEPLSGQSGNPFDYFEFAETIDRSEDIKGFYRPQFVNGHHEKALHLFNGDRKASVEEGGVLRWGAESYRQVSPLVFRNTENGNELVFVEDESGRIIRSLEPASWTAIHDKLGWWERGSTQILVLKASLVIVGLFTLMFFIIRIGKWLGFLDKQNTGNRSTGLAGWFVAAACLAWVVSWSVLWFSGFRDIGVVTFGLTPGIKAFLMLNKLAAALSLLATLATLAYLFSKHRTLVQSLSYIIASVACIALLNWTSFWNIL
jgi:CubicO group peptidase (beta-lactamase class C family)